jgi:MFS transporter, PAT family, beta-lactamase induction signal transducer AmpG
MSNPYAVPVSSLPDQNTGKSPWLWVPSLYFGQGLAYFAVTAISVAMYYNLGISAAEVTFFTGLLALPWIIKPFWSPFVEVFGTRRLWAIGMQSVMGILLASLAFAIPTPFFFQLTLAVFLLIAFSSATHDIAADGFYILALKQHQQAAFVGIRSTFFRASKLFVEGGIVILAGTLQKQFDSFVTAWTMIMIGLGIMFLLLSIYHWWVLPKPVSDAPRSRAVSSTAREEFNSAFKTFFQQPYIIVILLFLLTFRLGEAQALAVVKFFILDPSSKGGLGLSMENLGLITGTYGVLALLAGGILGGYVISRGGLKRWLWPMMLAVHVPNLAFVYLAYAMPSSMSLVSAAIVIESFGYGFGFAAYMLFMIMIATGDGSNRYKTAHYAICTGFMAAGMMIPGMASGWMQTQLGYPQFFIWTCICTIPSMIVALFLKIDPSFGKKVDA